MTTAALKEKKHIHFIGIGGSGMYPLAQILHSQGYYLTGSDNNETETLAAVRALGIKVFLGQKAENIEGADLIVYSAAIMADNPELIASKESTADVIERSDLLGLVTQWYDNAICVSGTHGKTTTTSMLTQIFVTAGVDVSAVIGGKLPCIGGSGRAGSSDIMLCEACEFVDTFLRLSPDYSVILNIDADHLDYFGTLENIIKSFHKFCENTSKAIIYNADDMNTVRAVKGIDGKRKITFGLAPQNDYHAVDISVTNGFASFKAIENGEPLCQIKLSVAGEHNICNALGAIAAARAAGASAEAIARGLEEFRGAGRRFEIIGNVRGITVADDYAHHPTEIAATLRAAAKMGFKRVWAVFQPFTFSRTAMLLDDFADALKLADKVVLTDIMGSREKNTYDIYSHALGRKIDGCYWLEDNDGHIVTDDEKLDNFTKICDYIAKNAADGDLVITLGCGDVYKLAKLLITRL